MLKSFTRKYRARISFITAIIFLLVTVFLFTPSSVAIDGSGFLSISSSVALAAQTSDNPVQTKVSNDPFVAPTLIFHSGFETGTTGEWASVTGSPSLNTSIKNIGSYSLRCATSGATAYVSSASLTTSYRFSFYLYINAVPSGDTIIAQLGTNTMTLSSALKIHYPAGGTDGAALSLQTWYRISTSGDGAGTTVVYVNGNIYRTEALFSSGTVLRVGVVTSTTNDLLFDDIAISTTASTADLGNIGIVAALPNAVGDVSNFDTPSPSTTHWQNVDEINVNLNSTDYNEQAGSTQVWDEYGIQDTSTLGISNVIAVNIFANMKTSNTASTAGISVKDNGTTYDTVESTTTSQTWYEKYYATMPNGGTAWTDARFDAFQVGAVSTGTARDTYIYAECVMVAYGVAPGNPSSLASPAQTSTSINLTWTKGSQADNTTIRYRSDGSYPTSVTNGTLAYMGTASSTEVTGLTASTTYKFRAWAYSTPLDLYSSGTSDLTQATAAGSSITNTPYGRAFGLIQTGTTYWTFGANTTAPSWPLTDAECYFSVTNTGAGAVNITIHGHPWTGTGAAWTLGTPGSDTLRERAWKSGDAGISSNVTITEANQAFIDGLASSGTKYWEIAVDMPTSVTDGNKKQGTITLTATAA